MQTVLKVLSILNPQDTNNNIFRQFISKCKIKFHKFTLFCLVGFFEGGGITAIYIFILDIL